MQTLFRAATLILVLCGFCTAQSTVGTVVLKNGDRISGSVLTIADGKATIDSPAAGKIVVDVGQLASIEGDRSIHLATGDGERLEGRIRGLEDGQVQIETASGRRSIALADLVSFRPPIEWTGNVALGGSLSSGNTQRRAANAQTQVVRRTDDNRMTLRATWDYGEQQTRDANEVFGDWELAQRRTFSSFKYDHFLEGSLYAWSQGTAENDRLSNLKLRTTGGAGAGYILLDRGDLMLQGEGGITYIDEDRDYGGADDVSSYSTAARIAYSLRWDLTADTQLLQDSEFYPNIKTLYDTYLRIDTRLRMSLTEKMFAQLQYVLDYDNTPAEGYLRADNRLIISVGWGF
jgi:putative salt-induced outer membrane protein YdiY